MTELLHSKKKANMHERLSGLTFRKLATLGVFGCLAGGIYAATFMVGVDVLEWSAFVSSVIAFAFSIPVSYFGNRLFTFQSRNAVASEASRFLTVQAFNLMATSVIVHGAKAYFSLPSYQAILAAFAIAASISIIMFEFWVYRQDDP
jgi:putative flippase GtrA